MVFTKINEFHTHLVHKISRQQLRNKSRSNEVNPDDRDRHKTQIILPYVEKKFSKLRTVMKKQLKRSLPNNIKAIVTYQSKKLFSRFYVKDKTSFCLKINLVYHGKCPNENCRDNYKGEIDHRIEERIIYQNKRNKNLQLLRNIGEMEHHHIWHENFKITERNYRSTFK